jgi:hypothetical protein
MSSCRQGRVERWGHEQPSGTGDRDTSGCRERPRATTPGDRASCDDALERESHDAYTKVDRAHIRILLYTRSDPLSIQNGFYVILYFVYVPGSNPGGGFLFNFFLLNHCAGTSLYPPPPLHFDHGGIYSLQVPIRSWARSMSANSIFACAAWYGLADLPRKIKHIRIHASEKENLSYLLCFLLPYVYTVWRQAKATHQNSQSDNDPVHLHSFIFFIWEKKGKASIRTSAQALASRRSRVPCLLRVPHPLPWSPAAAYAGNQTRP